MKKIFGILEHLFFYCIVISLFLFIFSNSFTFVYISIFCWFMSFVSHIIESKLENKSKRKIIVGA
ncbi:MAG: hypothetical protein QXD43_01500 [Candidatus Aenigmatarchaeota archaeon]